MSLTRFLCTLLRYSEQSLAAADPAKAAAHFGISEAHARGYIAQQRELRGIVSKRRT